MVTLGFSRARGRPPSSTAALAPYGVQGGWYGLTPVDEPVEGGVRDAEEPRDFGATVQLFFSPLVDLEHALPS